MSKCQLDQFILFLSVSPNDFSGASLVPFITPISHLRVLWHNRLFEKGLILEGGINEWGNTREKSIIVNY